MRHPGMGYFALTATSVSRPREAVYVAVHGKGVRLQNFVGLTRTLLGGIRWVGAK